MFKPMQLSDEFLSYRNPEATADLTFPVVIIPELNDEQASTNCRANLTRDIPWLTGLPAHDGTALVCGSAPSLKQSFSTIRNLRDEGALVFACNAAARYIHAQGIPIDYQVILDGSLVTLPDVFPQAQCHLLASILPGEFFDKVQNSILWHPCIQPVIDVVDRLERNFVYIGGGISVSLFTLCITYTMGYRKIHCFGMDSSFDGDSFHIDNCSPVGDFIVTVDHNGKLYRTTYDMKAQAATFLRLERVMWEAGVKVHVYGSGLLPDAFNSRGCPSCGQLVGHYDDCGVGLTGS